MYTYIKAAQKQGLGSMFHKQLFKQIILKGKFSSLVSFHQAQENFPSTNHLLIISTDTF